MNGRKFREYTGDSAVLYFYGQKGTWFTEAWLLFGTDYCTWHDTDTKFTNTTQKEQQQEHVNMSTVH